ncbi:wiskott-Aldrich syndrome protein family member 2-like [Anneissia japonica]|uniref:wiskott-Aldrich syndrome protein family member 2-like n=1 Tax=Anneissia japonica TaxID=1529436 RepID=UPI001425A473|nr:wiskott-Aldrich syndrome protein family member 2-like [Anneissia japonica]XP_033111788.1 wiskott-Aldrich syndrome protein family member 2-like [Anneissia japonica]XP_033111790.1 wiskott-Aldrich syndrome protein family member 2-like [Anneissia japonica]XP_033111791.1 wiskott-Aldrich syndrome protein family member 2-like [Anneissia japonica]
MPLSLRNVNPVNVSRDSREMKEISKNLEHFKNYTLVNIIRQLSNLSCHAEDIFTAIHQEATHIFQRTSNLRIKVKKLSSVIDTLDPLVVDDDLEGAFQRAPFCSKNACENNLLDRNKLPKCVQDLYLGCDRAPNFEDLTKLRDDGKKSTDFYSNPKFFFDRWRSEQEKKLSNRKKERPPKRRPYKRTPASVPTPCNSYTSLLQKKKQLELQKDGKEIAEIKADHIRAEMAQKMSKDGNDNDCVGEGTPGLGVYSEVSLEPVDQHRSISGGLLSALQKQGVMGQDRASVADETDVVADLLQRQMDFSESEDLGWDEDEWDEFDEDA